MKLNYITLKNFRQYYGEQTIHFATDKKGDRHVTVIHGVNGAGKTSLCIALNWCLYGDEFVKEKFGPIGELASKHRRANIVSNDTSVEVSFTYQDYEYLAERIYAEQGPTPFQLKKAGTDPPVHNEAASDQIQLMIPKEVGVHFFFDGEKIDNFALPGSEEDVREAVCNVLKIEDIRRGITHLKSVERDYNSDLKKALSKQPSNELQVLHAKKDKLQTKKKELSDAIAEKRQEIAEAERQKQDIDERLRAIEESRQLAEERKGIEEALAQFRQEESDLQRKIRELANHSFIPLAKPALEKALEILDKNEIPSVPEPLLQGLLEQMRCLCGRPIHDESQAHQEIRSLLKKAVSSKSATVVRDTYSELKHVSRAQLKEIPAKLKSVLSNNQKLNRDTEGHEARLKEISEKLQGFDQNEVRNLQNSRDQMLGDIAKLNHEISQNQTDIEKIDEKISELTKNIRRAGTLVDKTKQLKRYGELAEDALSAMEKIHELFAEDIRKKVEPKVREIFKKFVWKSSHFQDVRLSKEFELQVIDRFGEQARPELSAGERQVLSLAFIVAMAKVAVEEMPLNMEHEPFPIVIDTPFGRLAREPRENITEIIPEIADQLILFVTDTELGDKARANLEPYIGKEYCLQFDQETSITKIEQSADKN